MSSKKLFFLFIFSCLLWTFCEEIPFFPVVLNFPRFLVIFFGFFAFPDISEFPRASRFFRSVPVLFRFFWLFLMLCSIFLISVSIFSRLPSICLNPLQLPPSFSLSLFYRHITFSRTMHLNWISICCLSLNCYYKAYKCCFSDEVTRKREVTNAYEANARDHTTYEYMRPRYKCFHFFALYFSRVPQWGMNLSSAKHTYHWNDVSSTSQFWMYYL